MARPYAVRYSLNIRHFHVVAVCLVRGDDLPHVLAYRLKRDLAEIMLKLAGIGLRRLPCPRRASSETS